MLPIWFKNFACFLLVHFFYLFKFLTPVVLIRFVSDCNSKNGGWISGLPLSHTTSACVSPLQGTLTVDYSHTLFQVFVIDTGQWKRFYGNEACPRTGFFAQVATSFLPTYPSRFSTENVNALTFPDHNLS